MLIRKLRLGLPIYAPLALLLCSPLTQAFATTFQNDILFQAEDGTVRGPWAPRTGCLESTIALSVKARLVIYAFHEQIWLFFLPFLECLNRRLVF